MVKQRTPLLPGYNKAVQVGRTVINFSVKANHTNNAGGRRDALQEIALDEEETRDLAQIAQPNLRHQVTNVPLS